MLDSSPEKRNYGTNENLSAEEAESGSEGADDDQDEDVVDDQIIIHKKEEYAFVNV